MGRLGALSTYWARRERVDTLEQMELHPNNLEGRRLKQMQGKGHRIDRAPPDDIEALDLAGPLLGRIYNHCILEGCRSVVRSGTVYVRNGLRGVFRQRYVFLLQGVVLFFETKHRDVYGVPTKTAYHLRKGSHSLRGCYIYVRPLFPLSLSLPCPDFFFLSSLVRTTLALRRLPDLDDLDASRRPASVSSDLRLGWAPDE